MNSWLWWLGQSAIAAALLIPFVLLACRLFRNRPAAQHVLWVVVLLKFLTPPLVTWPWTAEELRDAIWPSRFAPPRDGVATIPERPVDLDSGSGSDAPAGPSPPERFRPIDDRPTDPAASPGSRAAAAAGTPPGALWVGAVSRATAGVWLVGAVLCAALQLRRIARHAALVRRGTPAPARLRSEIGDAASRLGMRPPRAVLVGGIRSPFMWCLGRLRLVWPAAMARDRDVARSRGVIAHELAHARRGDHWVAWLELAAGVVWWWNPLFWFVRRRLRETAEMACDALAIGANPEGRRQYAEMLLELSAGFQSGAPAPVLAVRAGTPSSFERRLTMILSDRVSGKLSPRGILAAACLALVALPGWSPGQQEPPKLASPADDAVLRELIERGKFAEAKERLDALRKKQSVDKNVAEGVFPEKWKEILAKELPAACSKGIPKNAPMSWKACLSCHQTPTEGSGAGADLLPKFGGNNLGLPPSRNAPALQPHFPARPTGPSPGQESRLGSTLGAGSTVSFRRNERHYMVLLGEKGGILVAQNAEHAPLWEAWFAESIPPRANGEEWALQEPKGGQEVVLSWLRPGDRIDYHFDRNGGRVKRIEKTPRDKAAGDGTGPDVGKELKRANADLLAARAKIAQLQAANAPQREEEVRAALDEMEKAEQLRRLIVARAKVAYESSRAESSEAQQEYKLLLAGSAAKEKRDAVKARIEAAEVRSKRLADLLQAEERQGKQVLAMKGDRTERNYSLTLDGATGVLVADAKDGRKLWQYEFTSPLVVGRSTDDQWTVQESADVKAVVLTQTGKAGRVDYHLDLATGKSLTLQATPASPPAAEMPPPPKDEPRDHIKLLQLRSTNAQEMSKTLLGLFPKPVERGELILLAEPTTNTLLVRGRADDVATVEAVVSKIESDAENAKPPQNKLPPNRPASEGTNSSGGEKKLLPISDGEKKLPSLSDGEKKLPSISGGQGDKAPEAVRKQLVKQAADLLASGKSNEEVVTTLYRAVLERNPTRPEVEYCVNYLATTKKDRQAAITVIVLQLEVVKASDSK